MKKSIYLFAVILFGSTCSILGIVSITPPSYVAVHSDNSDVNVTITFTCILGPEVVISSLALGKVGDGIGDLVRVSGNLPQRGITYSRISRLILLTVRVSVENNNTLLDCAASPGFNSPFEHAVATFMVQGRLASPPNFIPSPITKSRPNVQRFTWGSPFTLNITDEDPDITGYRVCLLASEACVVTENTWYDFPSLAVPFVYRVAAINALGEGNSSSILHQACDIRTGML